MNAMSMAGSEGRARSVSMAGPMRHPQKARMNVHEICEHVYTLLRGEAIMSATVSRHSVSLSA